MQLLYRGLGRIRKCFICGTIAFIIFCGLYVVHKYEDQALPLPSVPKDNVGSSGSVDVPQQFVPAVDADVWWFAPFLDHSSFGVEAAGYVLSLLREQLIPNHMLHIGLLQVGDASACSKHALAALGNWPACALSPLPPHLRFRTLVSIEQSWKLQSTRDAMQASISVVGQAVIFKVSISF